MFWALALLVVIHSFICFDKGLTCITQTLKLFTVANLHSQVSWFAFYFQVSPEVVFTIRTDFIALSSCICYCWVLIQYIAGIIVYFLCFSNPSNFWLLITYMMLPNIHVIGLRKNKDNLYQFFFNHKSISWKQVFKVKTVVKLTSPELRQNKYFARYYSTQNGKKSEIPLLDLDS